MKEFIEEFSNWPVWAILIVIAPFTILFVLFILVAMTHFHHYSKPVVSKYSGFNTRRIIYECRCGKRKEYHIYRRFGDAFPIETTDFTTHKEFDQILNGADPETVLGYKFKKAQ